MESRNHEGYPDPTACAALRKMTTRYVYICSPYRDNPRVNIMRARKYCKLAVSKGRIPLAPHLYFPQFLSDVNEREIAMKMNFELMKICDEIWVFGDQITEGMAAEIEQAKQGNCRLRYFERGDF